MGKTIVFYGSTTGTCEAIAETIAQKLQAEVLNVTNMTPEVISECQNLILGTSTWGAGELQDDWYDGLKTLESQNLAGKVVAIFGCGDSCSYSDTFCSAMKEIFYAAKEAGATMIGEVATSGYSFSYSDAVEGDVFIGLPLDDINEADETEGRIDQWIEQIQPKLK